MRYAAAITVAIVALLSLLSLMTFQAARRDVLQNVGTTQRAIGQQVAAAVRSAMGRVEAYALNVAQMPWEADGWLGPQHRSDEYRRMLRLFSIVDAVEHFGPDGRRTLRIARIDMEPSNHEVSLGDPLDSARTAAPRYSGLMYSRGYEPTVFVLLDQAEHGSGMTRVQVNLRTLAYELTTTLASEAAQVTVTDRRGHVVLARDVSEMLSRQQRQVPQEPQQQSQSGSVGLPLEGVDGQRRGTLATWIDVPEMPWRVLVEQPHVSALASVDALLLRSVGGLAAIALAGVLLAGWLGRRLSQPIAAMGVQAARLAQGDLDARIATRHDDELGDLARQFNLMAATLQDTITHQEQRIAEKTQALERANRNKTEFLANMSHELRTPLAATLGFAEMLLEKHKDIGDLTPKQELYVGDIHASGRYLLSLINDLLDLNKVEAGQMRLEPVACDIAATVERSIVFVKQEALNRRLKLQVSVEPGNLMWRADPQRLKQMLTNLLANAIKFTSIGAVDLRARVEGDELCIEVRDTGCGIAAEHLPHLCEPFRQVPGALGPTEDRAKQGTGLGLALVRRLAELHGGTLEWESELGVGSLFRIRLPKGDPP